MVVFWEIGFIRGEVLVLGKSGCIGAKVVVFGQKWLSSVKTGYIRIKLFYSGKSGCIWSRVVVLGKKWLNSGKMFVLEQKWL